MAKYEIIHNVLPKLDTWILDFWNPHIMRFELIGSSNLHNKIKGNVSRQRAVLPVTYNYCFWTGDGLVIHHSINLPSRPAKTYMYCSRAFNSWALLMWQSTGFWQGKNKVIIPFPFVFLTPSLSYFNSIMVCSFRLVSCTGLWYSLCHILGNYCSSLSNKWPPPKEGAHLEGQNIKQAPLLNKPHLPPL